MQTLILVYPEWGSNRLLHCTRGRRRRGVAILIVFFCVVNPCLRNVVTVISASYKCQSWGGVAGGWSRYKLPGSGYPEGGPGSPVFCICFCLSLQYHTYLGSDLSCWRHLRPAAILCTTISALFLYFPLAGPSLLEDQNFFFFSPGAQTCSAYAHML